MMKVFSVRAKNVLHLFQDVMIHTIIIMAFECFLCYHLLEDDEESFVFLSLLILLVYLGTILIPALILHFNYIKYDKNKVLIFEKENIRINQENIGVNTIEEIIINATYQHFSGYKGATTLPYNDYFYYIEIRTKNNTNFFLTSLLGYELDKELKKQFPNLFFRHQIKSFPKIK